jgi:hypothetical protein
MRSKTRGMTVGGQPELEHFVSIVETDRITSKRQTKQVHNGEPRAALRRSDRFESSRSLIGSLDLDGGARFFELFLELVGFVL